MSGNSPSQLFHETLQSILSQVGLVPPFFSFLFPIPIVWTPVFHFYFQFQKLGNWFLVPTLIPTLEEEKSKHICIWIGRQSRLYAPFSINRPLGPTHSKNCDVHVSLCPYILMYICPLVYFFQSLVTPKRLEVEIPIINHKGH